MDLRWKTAGQDPSFSPAPDHPGVNNPGTPPDDATFVIWQDPSSYNPFFHGPPYLPGQKVRLDKQASSTRSLVATAAKMAHGIGYGLPTVLVFLKALVVIHQSHHWLTYGETYFADHLLFERLYNQTVEDIDGVAEKAVGTGVPLDKMHPGLQSCMVAHIVKKFCGDGVKYTGSESPTAYLEASLKAESEFMACMAEIAKVMKERGDLSRGVDNMLAGIEDKHEGHLYLLKQRLT
jgi:DNA-binding ferritin-like protein